MLAQFLPLIALLPLLASAANPDPTVLLFLPQADRQALVGSVISAKPDATTYLLSCPERPSTGADGDSGECGFDPPQIVTQGPSTAAATLTANYYSVDNAGYACKLDRTTAATCSASMTGGQTTTTLQQSEIQFIPVTITAGAEKLGSAGVVTASTETGSGSSETGSAEASDSTATSASETSRATDSTATRASTASAATATSTGGASTMAVKVGAVGAGMVGMVAAMI